jgi:prefoldin subunit 2
MAEGRSEQDIIREFNDKRFRLNQTFSKITELSGEAAEHELVIRSLETMDAGRKCFRLVGEVLVERTVGEVLPAVKKNKDNIETAINALQQQLELQKKDLSEFQAKYKIRVRNQNDDANEQATTDSKAGAQGVLVSSKA